MVVVEALVVCDVAANMTVVAGCDVAVNMAVIQA